jgi:asparagine synthase (glutamine-hydrolysing)
MSAIVGIYNVDGRTINASALEQMADRLAHRGPDGSGVWHAGPVGLGHRMLRTTPESLCERLPLVSADGRRVITADARIDNRDELVDAFGVAASARHCADSQLILHAYERWGDCCCEHLLGDFAFAIWDDDTGRLFCARDHMGVKPFYYYASDELFVFASEIKALFCLPEVPRQINETQIASYLTSVYRDHTITFSRDILRLPAAHAVTVSPNAAEINQYWSLDPKRELHFGSDEECEAQFRDLFIEAVRCRLRSAFPVGSQLSGGLDSSSVTCVARHLLAHERDAAGTLHTFSALFDTVPECDERGYINAVIAQEGLTPHYVHADRLSPLTRIDGMLWHQDEPFGTANLFMVWALCEAAREAKVRVLLDGEDGDSVVSHGSGFLLELLFRGQWSAFVRELNAPASKLRASRRAILWRAIIVPVLSTVLPTRLTRAWQKARHFVSDSAYLPADFAERIHVDVMTSSNDKSAPPLARAARERHYEGLTSAFLQHVLEIADKTAAACSLELRHPFFDRRLVEFCLALPTEQKVRKGWTRSIVRRALAPYLPREVQWRWDKSNLSPNFRRGLLTYERARFERMCASAAGPQRIGDYVDLAKLCSLFRQCAEGVRGCEFMLFKAAVLTCWLAAYDADGVWNP